MEKVHVVSLRDAFKVPSTRRANVATKKVKEFLEGRLKLSDVKIDPALNDALWKRGVSKPPRSIKIKILEEDDKVVATLA